MSATTPITTRTILLATAALCACSGGRGVRTERYAVGARDSHPAPMPCTIVSETAGAVVALPAQSSPQRGVDFEALAPGRARIACGDPDHDAVVEVQPAARVELHRIDDGTGAFEVGDYAPTFCLVAWDAAGNELELGTMVVGAQFTWSDQVSRVVDHGMGGAGSARCSPQQMGDREGAGTVVATWRGFIAKATFEVRGRRGTI